MRSFMFVLLCVYVYVSHFVALVKKLGIYIKAVLGLNRRKTEEEQDRLAQMYIFLSVTLHGFVCTKPSTSLLWSSPGVQLRVTSRRLGSVIWSWKGGSGRSDGGRKQHHYHNHLYTACLNIFLTLAGF